MVGLNLLWVRELSRKLSPLCMNFSHLQDILSFFIGSRSSLALGRYLLMGRRFPYIITVRTVPTVLVPYQCTVPSQYLLIFTNLCAARKCLYHNGEDREARRRYSVLETEPEPRRTEELGWIRIRNENLVPVLRQAVEFHILNFNHLESNICKKNK